MSAQTLGFIIIGDDVVLVVAWLIIKRRVSEALKWVATFIAFVGCVLVLADRIVEMDLGKFGKYKAEITRNLNDATNTVQEIKDAKGRIASLEQTAVHQSATIGEAFEKAKAAMSVSEQASNKVAELNVVLTDARTAITNLNEQIYISKLWSRAQNYDREAFFLLFKRQWPVEEFEAAKQSINQITIAVDERVDFLKLFSVPEFEHFGIDLNAEPLDKILSYCLNTDGANTMPNSTNVRFHVLKFVFQSKKFTEAEKMSFAVEIAKRDRSLLLVQWACKCLDTKRNSNRNFMDLDGYLNWYEKNKAGFKTSL